MDKFVDNILTSVMNADSKRLKYRKLENFSYEESIYEKIINKIQKINDLVNNLREEKKLSYPIK